MGSVIITWIVYESTRSALAITALGIVGFVPSVVFGIFAGAIIDRYDRRRVMIACDVGRVAGFAVLISVLASFGLSFPVILAVMLLSATLQVLDRPAQNTVIPQLLPKEELTSGNAAIQSGSTAASFIGSPLGGIALVLLGAVFGLVLNLTTYALSALLLGIMVLPMARSHDEKARARRTSLLKSSGEGLSYLRSQPELLTITLVAMAANFFMIISMTYTVIYAAQALHQGAWGYGVLLAGVTGGFSVGALLPGPLGLNRAPGLWYASSGGFAGLGIVGMALFPVFPVALALTTVVWVLNGCASIVWLSAVQRTVPNQFLGRVLATDQAGSTAMVPAGQIVGGLLILTFGILPTYLIAGIGFSALGFVLLFSRSVVNWARPQSQRDSGSVTAGEPSLP